VADYRRALGSRTDTPAVVTTDEVSS